MVKTGTSVYIRAIELMVKDAFPGHDVEVVVELPLLNPDMVVVNAFVDGFYGAYVTVPAMESVHEQDVALALIGLLQDRMKAKKGDNNE